jgi:hypothetical protein
MQAPAMRTFPFQLIKTSNETEQHSKRYNAQQNGENGLLLLRDINFYW